MKIIKYTLFAILIVLAVTDLIDKSPISQSLTPFILILIGLLNLFYSFDYYKKKDKTEAIITFLMGLFILILGFLIL